MRVCRGLQSIRIEYYNALVGDIGIVYQNMTIIWNICHRYGGHPHSTVDILSLATIAYHFFDLVYSAEYQHAGRRQTNEHPSSPDKQLTKRMHSIIPHFHPLPHHFHHKSTPTSTNTSQLPNRTQQPTANPQQATTAIISGDQKQNTQPPSPPSTPTRPHQHNRQYHAPPVGDGDQPTGLPTAPRFLAWRPTIDCLAYAVRGRHGGVGLWVEEGTS